MNYEWDFSFLWQKEHIAILWDGLLMTFAITGVAIIVGTPLGIIGGVLASAGAAPKALHEVPSEIGRIISKSSPGVTALRRCILILIDVIRAIPLLLLILIMYYGLPIIANSSIVVWVTSLFGASTPIKVSAFVSACVAIVINLAAFIADIVRGAAFGVSRGSILAGYSLGMTKTQVWRRIVFPDIMREVLPGLTLLYITIFKMSTLASAIAIYELLHSAESIIQKTFKPLEVYAVLCAVFIIIVTPLAMLARRLESSSAFSRRSL